MTKSLDAAAFPPDVDAMLRGFFDAVSTMMINR
jgi:hypothetical protein